MKNFIVTITTALAISGCAFPRHLHEMGVDFNHAVARINDENTLLNVLRARDYRTMHFTAVTAFNGSVSLQGNLGLQSSIGGGSTTRGLDGMGTLNTISRASKAASFTPSASAAVTSNPNIEIEVLESQEFTQGITTSVPASTVAHYLNQGWPSELAAYLFVKRVEITVKKNNGESIKKVIVNEPHIPASAEAFRNFINDCRLEPIVTKRQKHKILNLNDIADKRIADIQYLDGGKFDLKKTGEIVRNSGGKASIDIVGENCEISISDIPINIPNLNRTYLELQSIDSFAEETSTFAEGKVTSNGEFVDVEVELVLRSVQNTFYFLGQYLRRPYDNTPCQRAYCIIDVEGQSWPIIDVIPTNKCDGRCFITTTLEDGRSYGILNDKIRYSGPVLTILQQLVNLQKSESERPSTQNVRVIN